MQKRAKFHRERDLRRALLKGLAESLIINESIETTLPKAKAVVPYLEKLITKAKKGGLHNRRQILASLQTVSSTNKLFDQVVPNMTGRTSGHLRIVKTDIRRGDNAQLARVTFVDKLSASATSSTTEIDTSASATKNTKVPPKTTKSEGKGN